MTGRTHLRRWLGLALGLHALALAWALRPKPAPPADPPGPPMQLSEADVDVEPPPVSSSPEAVASALPGSAGAIAPAPPRGGAMGAGPRSPAESGPSPAADTSGVVSVPGNEGTTWTFSPTAPPPSSAPLAGLGLGGAIGAGVRATVAESTRRPPTAAAIPMFTAHDINLGLVPGSNLVGLTRERVRIGLTSKTGHAVLEFRLDGSGIVASVQVVDASSDRAEWDEVAARLVGDARSGPPARMPAGARGVTLTLSVDSSERTVSGSTPTGSAFTKALRAIDDPIDAVLDGKTPVQRVVAVRIVGAQAF